MNMSKLMKQAEKILQSEGQDGDNYGVYGKIFGPSNLPSINPGESGNSGGSEVKVVTQILMMNSLLSLASYLLF